MSNNILTPEQIANFAANRISDSDKRKALRETITTFSHDLLQAFATHLDEVHGGEPFASNELKEFLKELQKNT